jgi:hypothetical protein
MVKRKSKEENNVTCSVGRYEKIQEPIHLNQCYTLVSTSLVKIAYRENSPHEIDRMKSKSFYSEAPQPFAVRGTHLAKSNLHKRQITLWLLHLDTRILGPVRGPVPTGYLNQSNDAFPATSIWCKPVLALKN